MAAVSHAPPRKRSAAVEAPPAAVDPALAAAEAYWVETRRPFVCLLFLAPLLIAYETGVLWLGGGAGSPLRNGADHWMRSWFYAAGVHHSFALPLVVLGLLLVWNFYGYFSWKVRPETLGGMLAESLIYAFLLVVAGQVSDLACRRCGVPTVEIRQQAEGVSVPLSLTTNCQSARFCRERPPCRSARTDAGSHWQPRPSHAERHGGHSRQAGECSRSPGRGTRDGRTSFTPLPVCAVSPAAGTNAPASAAAGEPLTPSPSPQGEGDQARAAAESLPHSPARRAVARAVTFVGAGVYEEVLFRLLLLPACYAGFRVLRAGPKAGTVLAVLSTSLLFALAHYVGPAGDQLLPYTFCFRAAAGVCFAAVFLTRGFGITVGAHAFYDVIVGLIWA